MDTKNVNDLAFEKANNYYRSVVFDQSQLNQTNTRFQVIKVPPGETVSQHYHRERTEVFVLLQGDGSIYINDKLAISKPHDIALCKPNDTHEVINTGDTNMLIGVFALNHKQDDSFAEEEA